MQFLDRVDTFEYPSFELAMAELGSVPSDDEQQNANDDEDDDDDDASSSSTGSTGDAHNNNNNNSNNNSQNVMLIKHIINVEMNDRQEELLNINDDVDDDELERLARINAKFNSNNLAEKSLKPKGTNLSFSLTQHRSIARFRHSAHIPSHASRSIRVGHSARFDLHLQQVR